MWRGGGDVVGVGGARGPDHLRIDVRSPPLGVPEILEDEHRGTLAHDEPVTAGIEGHRHPAARQGGHVGEAGDPDLGHRRLGGAREDHIAAAGRD